MNRELLTIIESLCHRVEHTGYSGLSFIDSKPELCRALRFRRICTSYISGNPTDCNNCYFSRSKRLENLYTLKLERLIQRI